MKANRTCLYNPIDSRMCSSITAYRQGPQSSMECSALAPEKPQRPKRHRRCTQLLAARSRGLEKDGRIDGWRDGGRGGGRKADFMIGMS